MARRKRTSTAQPLLLSVPDVAIVLGVCPATVYNLMRSRGLPSVKIGSMRRIYPESLQAWLKQQETA
jgi:excisionase family DNA binding protein